MNLQIVDKISPNTPVIIGVGQSQMDVPLNISNACGPINITADAIYKALTDTGVEGVKTEIDRLTSIRLFSDSGPVFSCPFGQSTHMPASISNALDINPQHLIYSKLGGDQPQIQIAETAKALQNGTAKLAVVCGGEAMANMKTAMRRGEKLDWSDKPIIEEGITYTDHGFDVTDLPVSPEEVKHGFHSPLALYALIETAHRLKLGLSVKEYQKKIGRSFAPFSKIAKNNPYAMFKTALSESDISEPSDKNPLLVSPYTKAMVAKDSVNQGAAVVMTTVKKAKEMGVSQDKWVFLNGYARGSEPLASERPDIDALPILEHVIKQALKSAELRKSDINIADFYSCFPIVIFNSIPMLKEANIKQHTLTGGLPFFGGPGNNYTLHAIAEMVATLRGTKDYGLVHGNGGIMTKHVVGIYSTQPKKTPVNIDAVPEAISVTLDDTPTGRGLLLSYCLKYKKAVPSEASVLLCMENGLRALARFEGDLDVLETLELNHPMNVKHEKRQNIAMLFEK